MNIRYLIFRFVLICIFLYLTLAAVSNITTLHPSILKPTRFAYYNYLIDAFMHGRLYVVDTISNHDLSLFKNNWYLYWGPAPVLFILPFYVIFGLEASDIIYTVIAGIANILLLHLVMEECLQYFKIKISSTSRIIILACFAISSPLLSLSVTSGIWRTNQVIASFYLLVSYLFFFKYLKKNTSLKYLVISAIFFNLAWLSRYLLVFNILMYLYPILIHKEKLLMFKKSVLTVGLITAFSLTMFGAYNYLRFGSVTEMGHRYQWADMREFSTKADQKEAIRYTTLQKEGQAFSLRYVPMNLANYFFNHAKLMIQRPYISISEHGNSIVSISPFFILIVYVFQRKHFQQKSKAAFIYLSIIIIAINMALLLGYVTSGWMQMGSRYFLDVVPLWLILTTMVIDEVPYSVQYTLLFYGVLMNIFGIFRYFGLF